MDVRAAEVDPQSGRTWRRLLPLVPLFAASRMIVLFAAHVADVLADDLTLVDILHRWDSGWYLTVVTSGYDRVVPEGSPSNVAFFPLLPMLIRAVRAVTGLSPLGAGLVVSLLGGLAGTLAVYLLAERVAGSTTALRAAALWTFFPAAYVLSMVYTEGLFVAAAALCLLCLLDERWLPAGAAAAVASATRPNGLVLAACCAFVAFPIVVRQRTWRPLVAVALAPLGALAYAWFLHRHTGRVSSWLDANSGFGQEADFGASVATGLGNFAGHPLGDFNLLVAVLATLLLLVGVGLMVAQRQPLVMFVYVAGIMVPVLLKTSFGGMSRYLMTAFPVVVALAAPLRTQWSFAAVLGVFAGAMTALMVISGASLALTP